jgi:hypothetical protein
MEVQALFPEVRTWSRVVEPSPLRFAAPRS